VVAIDDDDLGAAINAACKLIHSGTEVLRLTGSRGFVMERSDIESECYRRTGQCNR
jgi:hypothetical protein